MRISTQEQINELMDLQSDYSDFLDTLSDQGITEIVPLLEFAFWRNQEFEARDEFTNPIPAIN